MRIIDFDRCAGCRQERTFFDDTLCAAITRRTAMNRRLKYLPCIVFRAFGTLRMTTTGLANKPIYRAAVASKFTMQSTARGSTQKVLFTPTDNSNRLHENSCFSPWRSSVICDILFFSYFHFNNSAFVSIGRYDCDCD